MEENRVAYKGIFGTRHNDDDELVGKNTETLSGQYDRAVETWRQREEALRQRQREEQETLGLSSTIVTQDENSLSPTLEEAIKRGGEASKEVIIVEDWDEVAQGPDDPINGGGTRSECPTI